MSETAILRPVQAFGLTRWIHPILTILAVVVMLAVWQYTNVPAYILPKPGIIALRMIQDVRSGVILPDLYVTFVEVIVGFFIALVAGVVLGTFIALNPYVSSIVYPFVLTVQTVPKVAVAPLFLIWFGFGIQSKIVTAALLALFPILVNVIAGLRDVEPRRLLLMRSMQAGPWEIFIKVRLPSMLPYLFAGLEVAIVLSVIGAIVAEFVGSSVGLGSVIVTRQSNIDLPGVFSALIYLSLMGLILSLIVQRVTKLFVWSARTQQGH